MMPGAQIQMSIYLLEQIELNQEIPADQIISKHLKTKRFIGAKDRRIICEVIYTVIRFQESLQWWIREALEEHINYYIDSQQIHRLRVIAYLVLFEKLNLRDIEKLFTGEQHQPSRMETFERRFIKNMEDKKVFPKTMPLNAKLNYPQWLEKELKLSLGDTFEKVMEITLKEAPLDLRINPLKININKAKNILEEMGADVQTTPFSPLALRSQKRFPISSTKLFKDGLIEVQDEGSQLIGLLANAKPGMNVIDYCAGAGGKTLVMGATMQNKGRLTACDVVEWRLSNSLPRFRRAGLSNINTKVLYENNAQNKWLKRAFHSFDRVLIDVPCSGTGTWRRNPDSKWRLQPKDLRELIGKQKQILKTASKLVKKNGWIIYATCSMLKSENEDQISEFLRENPQFKIIPISKIWDETIKNACPFDEEYLKMNLYSHETDGFFACIMERVGE